MAILTTPRLTLRPLTKDDAPAMFKNWTWDERVSRYCRWFPHETLSQTEDLLQIYLEQAENGFDYRWGIEKDGELMGIIDVVETQDDCATIGYVIGHEFWNKGYMSESLSAVIEYLFSCGFSTIKAEHHIDNPASGRVMEKCGMRYVGNRTGIRKFGSQETCILKCYQREAQA